MDSQTGGISPDLSPAVMDAIEADVTKAPAPKAPRVRAKVKRAAKPGAKTANAKSAPKKLTFLPVETEVHVPERPVLLESKSFLEDIVTRREIAQDKRQAIEISAEADMRAAERMIRDIRDKADAAHAQQIQRMSDLDLIVAACTNALASVETSKAGAAAPETSPENKGD